MIENLLWPKKLSTPPQLLIDPEVMFDGEKGSYSIRSYESLVSLSGPAKVRYTGLVPNGFMIGFITDLANPNISAQSYLKLPFQDISAEILQYKMHYWDMNDVYLLSTPTSTKWKTNLSVPASIKTSQSEKPGSLRKPLFKMVGESLEDGGSKPQFSSNMGYSIISYEMPKGFKENLELEFPDMFSEYPSPELATLAIETVVKVNVISATDPDGFKVGIVSS